MSIKEKGGDNMNLLEEYRQKNRLSYKELGDLIGITYTQAWRWCNEGITIPKSIRKIAKLLKKDEFFVFKKMLKGKKND